MAIQQQSRNMSAATSVQSQWSQRGIASAMRRSGKVRCAPPVARALVRHNAEAPRRLRADAGAFIIRTLAEGADDSARMTEIPVMSSLFKPTID